MKNSFPSVLLFILCSLMITGCGAEKYATQRRNLMLISKSEMPNNGKYKEPGRRKTNKIKTNKAKRKSLY